MNGAERPDLAGLPAAMTRARSTRRSMTKRRPAKAVEDSPPRVLGEFLINAGKASEAAGHLVARGALVRLILEDPRWDGLFDALAR